jgi:hypothetical protein
MATETVPAASQGADIPELCTMEGRYLIDPTTSQEALGNDIGCLLEAVQQALDGVIADNGAAPVFPALYLLQMARGAFALYSTRVEYPQQHGMAAGAAS